ncbi:MAG: cytochrome c maturation protein CcmE [Armatimonadetes bacterium]|nr:cytochrome c maturation protein CcmE [Armatimonadota bacterium]
MKIGVLVSVALAVAAVGGLTAVFVNSSSPYVTIKDANTGSTRVHVVGEILPDTLKESAMTRDTRFTLKDETGTMPVMYVGPQQSNLDHATRVVVIGNVKDGVFKADQMLVKCPSKYENENKAAANS